MNWEALGAIAELLGALAVFLTLAYLTIQVRQNSKALDLQNQFSAAQIMQSRTDTVMSFTSSIISSNENLEALALATITPDELDPDSMSPLERRRYMSILNMSRSLYENVHEQYRQGFLTEDFYQGLEQNISIYTTSWLKFNIAMSSAFKKEVLRIDALNGT